MKWAHFNEMAWPIPDSDIEWKLRYGNPTRQELLCAASVVSAYRGLIERKTQKQRNDIVRNIRAEAGKSVQNG